MTEQEYIDATNLAKLRTAMTIARDTLPMRPEEEPFQKEIQMALAKWVNYLEPIVARDSESHG